jgi:hypothetical protein
MAVKTAFTIFGKGIELSPLAMKSVEGSRTTATHIRNFGSRWMWVANFTLRPLYAQGSAVGIMFFIGGLLGSRTGLDASEKSKISCFYRDPNPRSSSP